MCIFNSAYKGRRLVCRRVSKMENWTSGIGHWASGKSQAFERASIVRHLVIRRSASRSLHNPLLFTPLTLCDLKPESDIQGGGEIARETAMTWG